MKQRFVWLLLALTLSACRPTDAGRVQPAPAVAVKLAVEADGIYEAPAAALKAAGFDLTAARPEELSLTNGGQPVAFSLEGQGKNRALRFYGQAPGRDTYGSQNSYWLSRRAAGATPSPGDTASPPGDATLPGILERPAAPSGAAATNVFSATLHLEEERQYYSQGDTTADRWVWQTIFAPADVQVPFQVPRPAGGESLLRLRLVGISSAPIDPDHHLILALNGADVADARWDGLGAHIITATIPAGALHAGENSLAIRAPGDTGAPVDSVLLDWVELTYQRELALEGDELVFAGQTGAYALAAAAKLAALWDITDPAKPVALTGYTVQDGAVRFASEAGPRRFIAATQAGLRKPAAIVPASGPDPATGARPALGDWPGGADMIIVTVPEFRAALSPLVAARQAQGLRVAVVDATQVYDSFGYGQPGPEAIRALVQHARSHWTRPAPRYLLLAGDASYDPRGHLKGAELDLVPTQTISTTFSGWTASDVWYGLDDDNLAGDGLAGSPALAVGRFPAQTAEQLAIMVAKTLEYERDDRAAAWRSRALLVADGSDPAFPVAAQAFAQHLRGYTTQEITSEGDGSTAHRELLEALDAGIGLLGYFGHGSVTIWAKEKVFGTDDVARLANRDRLPIVFTVTCLSGFFQHPSTLSLGETLLRAKNGGAVAALVPSSAAVLTDQDVLARGLADALAEATGTAASETLGDTVLRAQKNLADASQGVREVLLTFNLLGDPSLPLMH
jgi:hypothetical protein